MRTDVSVSLETDIETDTRAESLLGWAQTQ